MMRSSYWSSTYARRTTGKYSLKLYVAGDELLLIRASASASASRGATTATAQANHPCTSDISNTGITDHSCITPAHETLP